MDPIVVFLIYCIILVAVSMAGAYLPYIKKLDDKQLHLLIALSAGIFLGILFLMLMPETLEIFAELGHEGHEHGETPLYENAAFWILIGFLVIMFVDVMIKHFHMNECDCECHEDEHRHNLTSLSAFIGLSVHACFDGLMIAAALEAGETVGLMALIAMCIHKFVVLFSLSSTFLLTSTEKRDAMKYLMAFALITPISGLLFFVAMSSVNIGGLTEGIPLAFACGSFLFVTMCDMVPEAFHRKHQDLISFAYIIAGVIIVAVVVLLINAMGGHIH